jgi:cytochrome c-type biogenesis protein CcmF
MQVAHLGVAVFIIGVTLVTGYQSEQDVRMQRGDVVKAGGYDFQFVGVTNVNGPNYIAGRAEIVVSRNGQEIERLYPEKRNYTASGNVMTETAVDSFPEIPPITSPFAFGASVGRTVRGMFRHLYVSLGEPVGGGAWSVRVYYKPFVGWIWGGAVLMALGGGLALSDRRYALAARKEREARETVKAAEVPSTVAASGD